MAARPFLRLFLALWLAVPAAAQTGPARVSPAMAPAGAPWAHALLAYRLQNPPDAGSMTGALLAGLGEDFGRLRVAPLVAALEARGLAPESFELWAGLEAAKRKSFADQLEQAAQEAAVRVDEAATEAARRVHRDQADASASDLAAYERVFGPYLSDLTRLSVGEARTTLALQAKEGAVAAAAAQASGWSAPSAEPTPIVVLSGKPNSGHAQAARAVVAALRTEAPDTKASFHALKSDLPPAVSKVGDTIYAKLLEHRWAWDALYDNPKVDRLTSPAVDGFLKWTGKKIADRLEEAGAECAVCTQALMASALVTQARQGRFTKPIHAVLTDFTVNTFWVRQEIAKYFVPTPEVQAELVRRGVAPEKVVVSGIPIHPKFNDLPEKAEARRALGLETGLPTLLVTGGNHGLGSMEAVVDAVRASGSPAQVVVVAGGNVELFLRLKSRYAGDPRVRVKAYVDDMELWMAAADLMVGKPGGLTTAESLVAGVPLLIVDPLPGQEARNTVYLTMRGAAVVAEPAEAGNTAAAILSDGPRLAALQAAARALARPDAAAIVARHVAEAVSPRGPPAASKSPAPEEHALQRVLEAERSGIVMRDFKAKLLADNQDSLVENVRLLDEARTRASIVTYEWSGDLAGSAVAYAAIRAARRGADVSVIVDAFPLRWRDRRLFAAMAAEGVKVHVFRPLLYSPRKIHKRLHDKAIWADTAGGTVEMVVGGRNRSDRYLRGHEVLDLDVALKLDAATGRRIHRRQFEGFLRSRETVRWTPWWFENAGRLSATEERQLSSAWQFVRLAGKALPVRGYSPVGWGVYVRNRGRRAAATRALEHALRAAKRRLMLAHAYFIPNARQRELLKSRLEAGVKVKVFSNSFRSTDQISVVLLMKDVVESLLLKGMALFERIRGEMHAKAAVVDDRWLVLGSTNLDARSEHLNTENGVVLDSPVLAKQAQAVLESQVRHKRFTPARAGGWRVLERVMRFFVRHFEWFH